MNKNKQQPVSRRAMTEKVSDFSSTEDSRHDPVTIYKPIITAEYHSKQDDEG